VSKNLVVPTHLQTKVQGHYLSLVWMVNNNILINMTVTNTDCLLTPTIILLSLVTWIPLVNKGDDTEKNSFISPDFVKSFISELLTTDRSMSLFDVNVMS
jgi:hypothetical protein